MKKIGDLMRDMGFNEKSSDEAKVAFLKYLMRESEFHDRVTAIHKYQTGERKQDDVVEEIKVGEQLSLFSLKTGTD